MSRTFTLTGPAPELTSSFYPPLQLAEDKEHVLGLISLETYNSIPNIDSRSNVFACSKKKIVFPTGSYEIDDIEEYLKRELGEGNVSLVANNNTLRCELTCKYEIDFTQPNSLNGLLGFGKVKLKPGVKHESTASVNILQVHVIRVDVNIVVGSYLNGRPAHTVHEFFPNRPPGFKLVENVRNVIYYPLNTRTIDTLTVRLVDQNNRLINFRNEQLTVRLHLKEEARDGS